jgi:hypothetical protein
MEGGLFADAFVTDTSDLWKVPFFRRPPTYRPKSINGGMTHPKPEVTLHVYASRETGIVGRR